MSVAVVELRGVAKAYGPRVVLREVDLLVPEGRMLALTGRSGSGKSTLLKLIAGLDRPTRGTVLVDGRDVGAMDDDAASRMRLHDIGLVFQDNNLLPDLSVRANVGLPLQLAGVPRSEAGRRVLDLLDLVGLRERADARPHTLSGGEAQRAAIARALANRPKLLLADEPTSSLDAASGANVLDAFAQVNREMGTTVVIVSHDELVTQRVRDRVEVAEGRLVAAPARLVQ